MSVGDNTDTSVIWMPGETEGKTPGGEIVNVQETLVDISDAIAVHEAATNPHATYETSAEVDAKIAAIDVSGDIDTAITAHEGLSDPHSVYETSAEAAAKITAHEALSNPHPTYLTQAEADALYAAIGAGGGGGYSPLTWVIGRYYDLNTLTGGQYTTSLISNTGDIDLGPVYIPEDMTIDQVTCQISTAVASSTVRIVLYSDLNGAPNSLVQSVDGISSATTGVKTNTVSWTLTSGWYWTGLHGSVNSIGYSAITTNLHQPNLSGFSDVTDTAAYIKRVKNSSYGAGAPATITSPTISAAAIPRICFRRGS